MATKRPEFISKLDSDYAFLISKQDQFPKLKAEFDKLETLATRLRLSPTYEQLEVVANAVGEQIRKLKAAIA